ncbi:Allantoicase [Spiromyces aspiralis]|uniref:Allantoicase n=1 Tax=Spiromyces aspiralis TaxID=68401 RepID=A0ACC1HRJ0_9FUNG|nr:Allantoicase [Spiromyces aspiralis]
MTFRRLQAGSPEAKTLTSNVDLASAAVGSRVISTTDEFFAAASNMLKVEPAIFLPDKFVDTGKWMDGWETHRHNKNYDIAVIKLGFPGQIYGFDVDTSHFTGNHAPEVSIDAVAADDATIQSGRAQWTTVLPRTRLDPDSHHLFALNSLTAQSFTHIRVNNYPDGGIARLRVYGKITPQFELQTQQASSKDIDLAFIGNGGKAIQGSNEHFTPVSNLILPGRGVNMGDGWETKRSRTPGHNDWVILKLGAPGYLKEIEIDTRHFIGNFPQSFTVHAISSDKENPGADNPLWQEILPHQPLSADRQHFFKLNAPANKAFTHVKVTIYPDGGIKRIRVLGEPAVSPAKL